MYERTYHAKVLKADEPQKAQRLFPWKKILWIGSVFIGIAGIIFLIRLPSWQVTTVSVEGANVTDPNDVALVTTQMIEGSYLRILPKSSILLVRPAQLALAIKARYPRFKEVQVSRSTMNTISVKVVEYSGVYLWCSSQENCSFMDETGIVFAQAPYFSGNAYRRIFIGEEQSLPFRPIDDEGLALVAMLDKKLQAISIEPVAFYFHSAHEVAISFLHHGNSASILIDPTRNIDAALEALFAALRAEPLRALYVDSSKTLEYLDLRFSNKVVYKFQ